MKRFDDMPLPPEIARVHSIIAEPWIQIGSENDVLEGPAFDRYGNLFISSVLGNTIFKITPDKQISTFLKESGLMPDGIAVHKDGRLFVACVSGNIISVKPDGSDLTYLEASSNQRKHVFNDLVFDNNGNLYVTDSSGTPANPTGGVYGLFAADDYRKLTPVYLNMAAANGIAVPPEGGGLWITEEGRGALHRIRLLQDGITIAPIGGARIACYYTGLAADSMKVDSQGNVYQAMNGQGRIQIMNRNGVPIANALIPGRDKGNFLRTTNLVFKPDTDEAYITLTGKGGAWVYKFQGLAMGLKMFFEQ